MKSNGSGLLVAPAM